MKEITREMFEDGYYGGTITYSKFPDYMVSVTLDGELVWCAVIASAEPIAPFWRYNYLVDEDYKSSGIGVMAIESTFIVS